MSPPPHHHRLQYPNQRLPSRHSYSQHKKTTTTTRKVLHTKYTREEQWMPTSESDPLVTSCVFFCQEVPLLLARHCALEPVYKSSSPPVHLLSFDVCRVLDRTSGEPPENLDKCVLMPRSLNVLQQKSRALSSLSLRHVINDQKRLQKKKNNSSHRHANR